jgi:hypothetical protein
MTSLTLELYFESDADRVFAERSGRALQQLVSEIAPNLDLDVLVFKAHSITRSKFDWGGSPRDVPSHGPSVPGRQTLLITREDIGAQGWGGPGACVVSKQEVEAKEAKGGNPADLLIHEWLHTLEGQVINGKPVPFADNAEQMGFTGIPGADGQDTWHDWYRFALGG